MNYDRVMELADVIERQELVPMDRFNMSSYCSLRSGRAPTLRDEFGDPLMDADPKDAPLMFRQCDTVVCALGVAAIHWPEISARHDQWRVFGVELFQTNPVQFVVFHGDCLVPKENNTPQAVASRLRHFVAQHRSY